MAECNVDTLMADGKCFNTLTPFQLRVVQTQLLAEILLVLSPGADVTPETLLADGKCFAALEAGLLNVVIAQLLCEIVTP